MRCPSCGTENAPGSRFCGGCGAKVVAGRVAPTIKVADGPASIPPGVHGAPSTTTPLPPPDVMMGGADTAPIPRTASIPPTPQHGPAFSSPSLSMAVAVRRPVGLIAFVLLLDLGLATAGAVMLGKGLSKPSPTGHGSASGEAAAPPPAGSASVHPGSAAEFVRPFSNP